MSDKELKKTMKSLCIFWDKDLNVFKPKQAPRRSKMIEMITQRRDDIETYQENMKNDLLLNYANMTGTHLPMLIITNIIRYAWEMHTKTGRYKYRACRPFKYNLLEGRYRWPLSLGLVCKQFFHLVKSSLFSRIMIDPEPLKHTDGRFKDNQARADSSDEVSRHLDNIACVAQQATDVAVPSSLLIGIALEPSIGSILFFRGIRKLRLFYMTHCYADDLATKYTSLSKLHVTGECRMTLATMVNNVTYIAGELTLINQDITILKPESYNNYNNHKFYFNNNDSNNNINIIDDGNDGNDGESESDSDSDNNNNNNQNRKKKLYYIRFPEPYSNNNNDTDDDDDNNNENNNIDSNNIDSKNNNNNNQDKEIKSTTTTTTTSRPIGMVKGIKTIILRTYFYERRYNHKHNLSQAGLSYKPTSQRFKMDGSRNQVKTICLVIFEEHTNNRGSYLNYAALLLSCQFERVISYSGSGGYTGQGSGSGSSGSSSGGNSGTSGCITYTGGYMSCDDASYSLESSESAPTYDSSDAILDPADFLIGVAAGVIDQVVNKTVESCFNDLDATISKFKSGLTLIDQGFSQNKVKDIEGGIADFVLGVNDVKNAYKACNVVSVYKSIEGIIALFGEGWVGAFELIVKEGIKIVHNKVELNNLFQNAIAYWKEESYYHAGFYVGRVIGGLIPDLIQSVAKFVIDKEQESDAKIVPMDRDDQYFDQDDQDEPDNIIKYFDTLYHLSTKQSRWFIFMYTLYFDSDEAESTGAQNKSPPDIPHIFKVRVKEDQMVEFVEMLHKTFGWDFIMNFGKLQHVQVAHSLGLVDTADPEITFSPTHKDPSDSMAIAQFLHDNNIHPFQLDRMKCYDPDNHVIFPFLFKHYPHLFTENSNRVILNFMTNFDQYHLAHMLTVPSPPPPPPEEQPFQPVQPVTTTIQQQLFLRRQSYYIRDGTGINASHIDIFLKFPSITYYYNKQAGREGFELMKKYYEECEMNDSTISLYKDQLRISSEGNQIEIVNYLLNQQKKFKPDSETLVNSLSAAHNGQFKQLYKLIKKYIKQEKEKEKEKDEENTRVLLQFNMSTWREIGSRGDIKMFDKFMAKHKPLEKFEHLVSEAITFNQLAFIQHVANKYPQSMDPIRDNWISATASSNQISMLKFFLDLEYQLNDPESIKECIQTALHAKTNGSQLLKMILDLDYFDSSPQMLVKEVFPLLTQPKSLPLITYLVHHGYINNDTQLDSKTPIPFLKELLDKKRKDFDNINNNNNIEMEKKSKLI
ncbi:hypothetical protein DFA_02366 [Cavenderia fasciculata]|uniref:Uncharacterized protein n=1 Tax=Cavenderia fasciculata TaxID=261658 RepID=F4PZ90_CACFS|nr:uncharacterized protein DFA_02366 [Cavenderia fasciculata]EGG19119.1 hypothetical protein DFA_02366 [Cavenderia fasciculata]|eukprot:XP_004366752.1 hypothetical protein DFA_02366 [Cavenderia fasciculata]